MLQRFTKKGTAVLLLSQNEADKIVSFFKTVNYEFRINRSSYRNFIRLASFSYFDRSTYLRHVYPSLLFPSIVLQQSTQIYLSTPGFFLLYFNLPLLNPRVLNLLPITIKYSQRTFPNTKLKLANLFPKPIQLQPENARTPRASVANLQTPWASLQRLSSKCVFS